MTDYYAEGMVQASINDGDTSRILLDVQASDWELKKIAESFHLLSALPKTIKGTNMATVPKTWAIVTQLARLANEKGFKWQPDDNLNKWIYEEFQRRYTEYEPGKSDLAFDVSTLERTPMPHQAAGAFVGALNKRFYFGDSAGTGKTATALLTLAELRARGENPFPCFIVTPAAVVDSFLEEVDAWGLDFKAVAYRGPKRKNLSGRYDVYVMSTETFRTDMQHPKKPVLDINGKPLVNEKTKKPVMEEDKTELPALLKFLKPESVVFDEAHFLVNHKSLQSRSARAIARVTDLAFCMSGTPITKAIDGLWAALNVLDIHSFPSQERYKDLYCDSYQKSIYEDKITGLSGTRSSEFFTLIQGMMRFVAKEDVLKDLPAKRYSVRKVDVPSAHYQAYKEMEEDLIAHVPDQATPVEAMGVLAQLTRLMQLACSACEVTTEILDEIDEETGQPKVATHVTPVEPSWKVDEMMNILGDNEGNPVVVFGTHASFLKLAEARAVKAGLKTGRIIGGQSAKERTKNRVAFQAGELDVIFVSIAAGGVGLTLTASDTAIYLERPWGYWQSSQSEDRIARKGQTRTPNIIDICANDTIDSKLRSAIRDKAGHLAELTRDGRILKNVLGGLD